jgi:hypothetical protein
MSNAKVCHVAPSDILPIQQFLNLRMRNQHPGLDYFSYPAPDCPGLLFFSFWIPYIFDRIPVFCSSGNDWYLDDIECVMQ